MEPPVRGDGVHRHDDDERRNRTAPTHPSGQTAPRGDLAAGVSAEIFHRRPTPGAQPAGLLAPVGVLTANGHGGRC